MKVRKLLALLLTILLVLGSFTFAFGDPIKVPGPFKNIAKATSSETGTVEDGEIAYV